MALYIAIAVLLGFAVGAWAGPCIADRRLYGLIRQWRDLDRYTETQEQGRSRQGTANNSGTEAGTAAR